MGCDVGMKRGNIIGGTYAVGMERGDAVGGIFGVDMERGDDIGAIYIWFYHCVHFVIVVDDAPYASFHICWNICWMIG